MKRLLALLLSAVLLLAFSACDDSEASDTGNMSGAAESSKNDSVLSDTGTPEEEFVLFLLLCECRK